MLGKDIRELVIVKMEEHTPFGDKSGETLLAGGDVLSEVKPIYSYIDATLHEAADEALLVIPTHRLTPIAIDLLTDSHLGKLFIKTSATDKRYYPFTSGTDSEGTAPNIVYGKTAGYSEDESILGIGYIKYVINREGVDVAYQAFRSEADDVDDTTYYYCYKRTDGVKVYTSVQFDQIITGTSVVYRDLSDLYITSTISETGSYHGTSSFFRGWVAEDGEKIYTHGVFNPTKGATYYSYNSDDSYMVSAGRIALVGMVAVASATPDSDDTLIGTIAKPFDWLRLHTLQMNGWSRPVHVAINPMHPLYNQQFSRWKRGHQDKPVVTDDGRSLHYYSQPASATAGQIDKLLYIPHFDEYTDYPSDVAEMIALVTAGKVFEIFSLKEQMEFAQKEIESVITTMQL